MPMLHLPMFRRARAVLVCTLTLTALSTATAQTRHAGRPSVQPHGPMTVLYAPAMDPAEGRRDRVLSAFSRSTVLRRCWERQLLADPTTPALTVSLTLRVDEEGRPHALALRPARTPVLGTCLARGIDGLPAVGPGEAFTTETTLHLDRGE